MSYNIHILKCLWPGTILTAKNTSFSNSFHILNKKVFLYYLKHHLKSMKYDERWKLICIILASIFFLWTNRYFRRRKEYCRNLNRAWTHNLWLETQTHLQIGLFYLFILTKYIFFVFQVYLESFYSLSLCIQTLLKSSTRVNLKERWHV
jgi:hypothetical protein